MAERSDDIEGSSHDKDSLPAALKEIHSLTAVKESSSPTALKDLSNITGLKEVSRPTTLKEISTTAA